MNQFIEQLKEMDACDEALDWIEEQGIDTVEEFWRVSDRSDWMLWLAHKEHLGIDIPTRTLQDLAIEFAEMALPYAGEYRQVCIDCIYATWQYLEGCIDIYELREKRADAAYSAAYSDAAAACAADAAAACAADAAAAAAAYAADAAYSAAYSSARASARAAAYAADSWLHMRRWQAAVIRLYVPEV